VNLENLRLPTTRESLIKNEAAHTYPPFCFLLHKVFRRQPSGSYLRPKTAQIEQTVCAFSCINVHDYFIRASIALVTRSCDPVFTQMQIAGKWVSGNLFEPAENKEV